MKTVRLICPICSKTTEVTGDKHVVSNYTERIMYKTCVAHDATPEGRILRAIFGKEA